MFLNIFHDVLRLADLGKLHNKPILAAFYFLLIQSILFDVAQILILNFLYSRYKIFYLF